MKDFKRILVLLLALALSFCFFACGGTTCTEHTDEDGNLVCDECGATIEKEGGDPAPEVEDGDIALISGKTAYFQIVLENDATSAVAQAVAKLVANLNTAGITVKQCADTSEGAQDCEVIVGTVSSRGDKYEYDSHTLGKKGYMIKIVDSKIVINGGSEDALVEAIEKFEKDILKLDSGLDDLVVMKAKQSKYEPQNNYRVTEILVSGTKINNYKIYVDDSDEKYAEAYLTAAANLQDTLYEKAGYWLEVVPFSTKTPTDTEGAIIIDSVDDAGTGFRVNAKTNGQLLIECEYNNRFEKTFAEFLAKEIAAKFAPIKFTKSVFTKDISTVTYEEFGAVGDGYANDFAALLKAHNFANECGQTIVASPTATYRIESAVVNDEVETIIIKTNCNWSTAKFIIDDTNISRDTPGYNANIFSVQPYEEAVHLTGEATAKLGSINRKTITKLDIFEDGEGYDALLNVYNSDHRHYIRYGINQNAGSHQSEIIHIDKDGNIYEDTPFMHDYEQVTDIYIYRADIPELVIDGGEFTTLASRVPITKSLYIYRGFQIARSNTVVRNLKHKVEGEFTVQEQAAGQYGAAYAGFFAASMAHSITLDSCIMSGRRYYNFDGTYDFQATNVNHIYLKNCTMYNFYKADGVTPAMTGNEYWGVGGTNKCKNMIYEDCELTRYDAHSGVYNGKIIRSKVSGIQIIGAGEMLIEDSIIEPPISAVQTIIGLRVDYGSTFDGTVTIRNTTFKNSGDVKIFDMKWANHDFGYTCYMPNLVLDNLMLADKSRTVNYINNDGMMQIVGNSQAIWRSVTSEKNLHLATLSDGKTENKNPMVPPEYVKVINVSGYRIDFYDVPFFANTVIEDPNSIITKVSG